MLPAAFGAASLAGAPGPIHDACPAPLPDLGLLQDETVREGTPFARRWPQNLDGRWFVVAVADRFQPPAEYRCTSYDYVFQPVHVPAGKPQRTGQRDLGVQSSQGGSLSEQVVKHGVAIQDVEGRRLMKDTAIRYTSDVTYRSWNLSARDWARIRLQGEVPGSAAPRSPNAPGLYREWPVPGPGARQPQRHWFVPIVHFEGAGSDEILVKWGCTQPPLGDVNFVEVLARRPDIEYSRVIQAVAHLTREGAAVTPAIGYLRPVVQSNCGRPDAMLV